MGGQVHYAPEEIKYVEVPVIQEIIKEIPKKEIVEVERRVPVIDYQYVDKIVEVPQIHYVDKIVEVPQIREVVRRVPIIEMVEVPKKVIRHVPRIETKVVEKIVEVPGEIIEVPRIYQVENKIVVPTYRKKEVPTVVSQKLIPTIYESETDILEVTVNEYVPKMVPVDVFVPKPISRQLVAESITESHNLVDVTASQWNALVFNANPHIRDEADLKDVTITKDDVVPTLQGPGTQIVPPTTDITELLEKRDEEDHYRICVSAQAKEEAMRSLSQFPKSSTNYNTLSPTLGVQASSAAMTGNYRKIIHQGSPATSGMTGHYFDGAHFITGGQKMNSSSLNTVGDASMISPPQFPAAHYSTRTHQQLSSATGSPIQYMSEPFYAQQYPSVPQRQGVRYIDQSNLGGGHHHHQQHQHHTSNIGGTDDHHFGVRRYVRPVE